jgi:DnaJ-class molecular chaperone
LKGGVPGDLYVTLELRVPENVTPEAKELYERLRRARGA